MNHQSVIAALFAAAVTLTGCSNTWYGVKQDTKEAAQATGRVIEKTGEKIQEKTQ